jgi:hypothetical protein
MYASRDLAVLVQRERERSIAASQFARLATLARACCDAPVSLIQRLARRLRPATAAC